jgi:hypothetical protein
MVGALATATETTTYRFVKNKNCDFEDIRYLLAITTAAL